MTFTWPSDSPPPTGSANSRRRRDASARPSHWTLLRRFQRIANWGACRKTPSAAQNHVLEAKEGGFCKVQDLLSTYGFRSGSNRWSDTRHRQLRDAEQGALSALSVPQPTDSGLC